MRREKVKNESSRGWNYLANQLRTPHLDFKNLLHPQPLDISADECCCSRWVTRKCILAAQRFSGAVISEFRIQYYF
jgi:hypothetical protein